MSFTFYSQAAYTHGLYVAKYRLEPILESQKALSSIKPTEPDEIMPMLAQYFSSHPARYSLDVQMCRDLDKQPVEDTQTEWKETDSPWETVAILELPVGQDSASDQRRVFWEDRMAIPRKRESVEKGDLCAFEGEQAGKECYLCTGCPEGRRDSVSRRTMRRSKSRSKQDFDRLRTFM
jgi:hypothetical protein